MNNKRNHSQMPITNGHKCLRTVNCKCILQALITVQFNHAQANRDSTSHDTELLIHTWWGIITGPPSAKWQN